jgi:hypothetical protein
MLNLLIALVSVPQAKISIQKQHQRRVKATTGATPRLEQSSCFSVRPQFPIWQVTLPLCGMLIYAIGSITTVYMINGRYLFYLKASPEGLEITTDVDKRENQPSRRPTEQKEAETHNMES